MSAAAQLAARTGRHSLVYGGGLGLTIVAGMASLAVFTRLMPPEEFGKLALMLALSGGLTLLSTVGLVQGVLNAVFGGSEDDGDDLERDDEKPVISVGRKREALGTGLLLSLASGTMVATAVWLAADPIAEQLLGTPREAPAVRLAGLAGGVGAVWRLLQTVPRLERRPGRYVALEVSRPVLAILLALPFVIAGDGAEGVLAGLALATVAMVIVALVAMRAAFRLTFEPAVLPLIARRGAAFVPYGGANWVMSHGGMFILAAGVSNAELGLYRVALTLGGLILYVSSVFFMAWLPLKRTSLFAATRNERGHGWIGGKLVTWLAVASFGVLIVLDVGATQFVRIAGPAYADAAGLILVVASAALAHSMLQLAYRVSSFPHKRLALGLLMPVAAGLFVAGGLLLVPHVGTEGVPLAAIGAYSVIAVVFVVLGQRGKRPVDFEYGKLAAIALVAAGCIAVSHQLTGVTGVAGLTLDAVIVLAYPALLLGLRVMTPHELRGLARVARETLRPERSRRLDLAAQLETLPPTHVRTLYRVSGPGRRGEAPAPSSEELVAALRAFGQEGAATSHEEAVSRYLVSELSRAERDAMARALWTRGVDPGELDHLEQTLTALRRLPPAAWRSAMDSS